MANWGQTRTADIVLITERGTHAVVRGFLQQLRQLGYEAHVLRQIGYDTNRLPDPRAVLVDISLRGAQASGGPTVAARARWEYVPVIQFLLAEEADRIRFDQQLEDFLMLPVKLPELEARLRFAQWKIQRLMPARELLEAPGLRMNLATYEVWANHEAVELTYKEFELLKFFLTHQRRVFSRAELLEAVWESDYFGDTRTVDVHIRRLRAKLGSPGDLIRTVRNVGYRFG